MAKTQKSKAKKKLGGPRVGGDGPRQAKADAVAAVEEKVRGSSAVLLTDYRGMTVSELAELRANLREAEAEYRVYKNTLASIAVRKLGLEDLVGYFEGPTAFAFANGDPVVAAKKLSDFAKRVPTLILKGGVLGDRVLTADDVNALGALDSREVMLSKLAGAFVAKLQQAANLFAAGFNNLGSLLAQLQEKLPAGEPDAAAAPAADVSAPADASAEGASDEVPEAIAEAASEPTPEAATPEAPAEPVAEEQQQTEPADEQAPEPAAPVTDETDQQ